MRRHVDRRRRAEIKRIADQIRQDGQRAGRPVAWTVDAIRAKCPEVLPLEAWRFAFGWTRAQVAHAIIGLYEKDGLQPPPLSPVLLCRWEHGQARPSPEYLDYLCRLYATRPDQLGFGTDHASHLVPAPVTPTVSGNWYAPPHLVAVAPSATPVTSGKEAGTDRSEYYRMLVASGLPAVRESLEFALQLEGPAGGQLVHDQLDRAVEYYALTYAAASPLVLFDEVRACRRLVGGLLTQPQLEQPQRHLQAVAGWLSALLGNLSFHLADNAAARLHLDVAFQLGQQTGDRRLLAWARGVQSMVALWAGDLQAARDLASDGGRHAPTPLVRAQLLAWAELRALAARGARIDALRTLHAASRELARAPHGSAPGRFGFCLAEFELHAAEALFALGQPAQARTHAQTTVDLKEAGSNGWSAAIFVLARVELLEGRPDQAAELGLTVLDAVPPERLRQTNRRRAATLDGLLARHAAAAPMRDFHERVLALPPVPPLPPV